MRDVWASDAPKFDTARLVVDDWLDREIGDAQSCKRLLGFVQRLLSGAVTRALPPSWAGPYDAERALQWIRARDAEASVSLVRSRACEEAIGLLIVTFCEAQIPGREARVGYLIDERYWGQGFASELVAGFVDWCCHDSVAVIRAGVEQTNAASIKVLERGGFTFEAAAAATGECIYVLHVGHDATD